jgi:UTP:GlnB (protein PII) uridylyltransferase
VGGEALDLLGASKKGGGLAQLLEDPEYRLLYVRFKIWVQHKRLPKRLLEDLDPAVSAELQRLYQEELRRYWRRFGDWG